MERYYQIAGLCLRIHGNDEELYTDDGILTEYRRGPGVWDHSVTLAFRDQIPEPTGRLCYETPGMWVYEDGDRVLTYFGVSAQKPEESYMVICRQDRENQVWMKHNRNDDRIYPKTVLKAMELEHLLTRHDTLLFHSTFIEVDGKAILFTAPSGVGKSTQAELWCRYRNARLINGDRTGIQWRADAPWACGVPFSGSSDVRHNETWPLAAIVCLSQAPVNTLTRLRGVRAFRQIWEGCTVHLWDRADVEQATQTVTRILGHVPVYALACTPDASAVEVLYQQLTKEKVL